MQVNRSDGIEPTAEDETPQNDTDVFTSYIIPLLSLAYIIP